MSFLVGTTTTTTTITATATATDPTPTTSDVSYLRDMSPVEHSLKHVTVLHLQCHNISPKWTTNTKQTLHSILSSIEIHSNDFLHKLSILSKHFHSQHITYIFFFTLLKVELSKEAVSQQPERISSLFNPYCSLPSSSVLPLPRQIDRNKNSEKNPRPLKGSMGMVDFTYMNGWFLWV